MSVLKQHHDAIPVRPLHPTPDPASARDKLKLVETSDAETFWNEFNRTIDEFFRTIHASKNHIETLAGKLSERDRRIEILEAENAALRDQVEMQRKAAPASDSKQPAKPEERAPVRAAESSRGPGIWSKLSRLERDAGASFDSEDQ